MLEDNFTYNKSLGNGEIKKSISLIIKYSNQTKEILSYQFRLVNVKNTALSYNEVDEIIENKKNNLDKKIKEQIILLNNLYKYLNNLGENDNVKSQDLSNTEMEEIRNQLDMMDNSNSIMPSYN